MWELIIWNILDYAIKFWASDIHITEWKPLIFRIDWVLKSNENSWIITSEKIKKILDELMNWNNLNLEKFLKQRDIDFAYIYNENTSFRVNAFYKLNKMSFVLRRIENNSFDMKSLWLPPSATLFTQFKQWLVLVTWPTWAWKSTTMVSILETINKERWEHILTIEDPVEFIFKDKKSIFSQREVWRDTHSFHSALKSALREDPNIIMVWELRDSETVNAALELAETWHLVISTLHTAWAVKTIDRLLSFFPIENQELVRVKLSATLKWVLSQRLIPKIWWWRVAIFELMFVNTWIRNLIRLWSINQIQSNIETWSKNWMITMKKYADYLRDKWVIEEKDYINYFKEDTSE